MQGASPLPGFMPDAGWYELSYVSSGNFPALQVLVWSPYPYAYYGVFGGGFKGVFDHTGYGNGGDTTGAVPEPASIILVGSVIAFAAVRRIFRGA